MSRGLIGSLPWNTWVGVVPMVVWFVVFYAYVAKDNLLCQFEKFVQFFPVCMFRYLYNDAWHLSRAPMV